MQLLPLNDGQVEKSSFHGCYHRHRKDYLPKFYLFGINLGNFDVNITYLNSFRN